MQLTFDDKKQIVQDIAEKAEEADVVGLLDMHELPAPQLQQIKKELKGTATIRMSRRTLIERGLAQAGDEYTELTSVDSAQPALIFSNDNPFTLFQTIQQSKSPAPAKAGATASKDITLEPGKTDLPPGPALGELQALGAETSVEDGSIVIDNEPVAVEAGEEITRDVALTLNKLGLKPLEVGLDLKAVIEDDVVYTRQDLDIDMDQYRADIQTAAQHGFNLAVETGFITPETIRPLLQQGTTHARNLAVESAYATPDTVDDLLRKGRSEATAVDQAVDMEDVDIEDEEGEEEDSEETEEEEDVEETDSEEERDGEETKEDEEETGDTADEQEETDKAEAQEQEVEEPEEDEDTETETNQTQSQSSTE